MAATARLLLRSLTPRRPPLVSSPGAHPAANLLHRWPTLVPGKQSGREFWGNLHAVLLRRGFGGSHSSSPSKTPHRIGLGAVANALSASFVCASAFPLFNQTSQPTWPHDHRSNSEKRRWTDDIIAVNLLVYVADIASKRRLTMWGARVNDPIRNGQIWRLATPALLHRGPLHIAFNTLSLASIGPKVEKDAGPIRFLAIYCTSALSGSLMSYWFSSARTYGVGASGAICGLVDAYAVYVWRHKELFRNGKEVLESVKIVVLLNVGIGILLRHRIDNWAHLGGFLGGAAVEWFYGPDWKRRPLFSQ